MNAKPFSDIRLPAEWEPQDGIQLTWPHEATDWAPMLAQVDPVFVAIARAVTRFERLVIVCHSPDLQDHVLHLLTAAEVNLSQIRFETIPNNDTWARDHGAITVLDKGRPQPLSFRFNGWGGKYAGELDNAITAGLARRGVFQATSVPEIELELEGGSIESDGKGSLLTTSNCLLNSNRNGGLSRSNAEATLAATLGVRRVLWLDHGYLAGDDTDSHIDTLARFAPENTIVYVGCPHTEDEHYHALKRMKAELEHFRTEAGHPYRLLELPWPQAVHDSAGRRLPATYANYLIINGAVLVPIYNDPADDAALKVIEDAYPTREIIPIPCLPLIVQHGSLHCVTMQFPQKTLA